MRTRKLLPLATIPDRCSEKWEEMQGTKTVRHCDVCDGTVYNLSEMTEEEAEALLHEDANRCVVMFRRKRDGKILNADTAPALGQPNRIAVASVALAFGAAVAATSVVAAIERPRPTHSEDIEVAMGGIRISIKHLRKNSRTKHHRDQRHKARQRRVRGDDNAGSEPKAMRRKKRRSRMLSPRELLRQSVKTERRAKRKSAPPVNRSQAKPKP